MARGIPSRCRGVDLRQYNQLLKGDTLTPERYRRLRAVLDLRQPDLTVLMDEVHKPHNLSVILRNCDAVGVLEAHAVPPEGELEISAVSSAGASKWVPVRLHRDISTAVAALRSSGFRVVAAHPTAGARDYREMDFTQTTALLVGSELEGVSDAGLDLADDLVSIPMMGMVRSLNVSVATSLLLYEAARQRKAGRALRAVPPGSRAIPDPAVRVGIPEAREAPTRRGPNLPTHGRRRLGRLRRSASGMKTLDPPRVPHP